ncbi:MAG TPA: serine O-acetyltransferase [bacterium]|jgi:serine O-acetyltransferase
MTTTPGKGSVPRPLTPMTLWQLIRSDYRAIFERDPAATNRLEVAITYTSFHAVVLYRLAHRLAEWRLPIVPRLISTIARFLSGVEIHPAAKIGPRFVIDHGTGVVIGETTEIGDNCLLFQGVTLGGTGKEHKKRHPTLGDHVVVGAGAKILGSMRIGSHTKIGSNAVVLTPVPDHCTVVGVPGRIVRVKGELPEEGMDHVHMPDPIAERFKALEARVDALKRETERAALHDESEPHVDLSDRDKPAAATDPGTMTVLTARMDGMASELKELRRQLQAANRKMNAPVAKKTSLTRKRRAAAHHRPHESET